MQCLRARNWGVRTENMEKASGIVWKYRLSFEILIGVCLCMLAPKLKIQTFTKNKQWLLSSQFANWDTSTSLVFKKKKKSDFQIPFLQQQLLDKESASRRRHVKAPGALSWLGSSRTVCSNPGQELQSKWSCYSCTDKETKVQSWQHIWQGHPAGQIP